MLVRTLGPLKVNPSACGTDAAASPGPRAAEASLAAPAEAKGIFILLGVSGWVSGSGVWGSRVESHLNTL